MKNICLLLSFVIVITSLSCKNKTEVESTISQSEVHLISTNQMQDLLKKDQVQLVDVRTLNEFKSGYIINAQNIDYNSSTFNVDILKLNKEKPVLLYCLSGGRSAKSAEIFQQAGFLKIYDLDGGITEWKQEGLPVEQ